MRTRAGGSIIPREVYLANERIIHLLSLQVYQEKLKSRQLVWWFFYLSRYVVMDANPRGRFDNPPPISLGKRVNHASVIQHGALIKILSI